jgi:hypothetical protein
VDVTDTDGNLTKIQMHNDMHVNETSNSCYVKVPQPGRTYRLVIGLLTRVGKFFVAAKSNCICVPRAILSPIQDENWMAINELILMSACAIGTASLGASEHRFVNAQTFSPRPETLGNLGMGSGGVSNHFFKVHDAISFS